MMKKYVLILGIILVVLAFSPVYFPTFYLNLLSLALIYGIFAMSLDILMGYAGLSSLGHAAYFGMAGYAVAIVNVNKVFEWSVGKFGIELLVGVGSAVILALVFGLLTVRSRGIYHMMLTLALSMMLWGIAYKWVDVTQGPNGIAGISRPDLAIFGISTSEPSGFFYFVLIFFVFSLAAIFYLIKGSSFGRVLLGIKDNELRMRSLGYNVSVYLYIVNLFAALFAGLSGVLFVYFNHYVSPSNLILLTSAQVLLMTILGGSGTLFGSLIGAGVIVFMQDAISTVTERWVLILGIIYVLVIIFLKRGIYGTIREYVESYAARRNLKKGNEMTSPPVN